MHIKRLNCIDRRVASTLKHFSSVVYWECGLEVGDSSEMSYILGADFLLMTRRLCCEINAVKGSYFLSSVA